MASQNKIRILLLCSFYTPYVCQLYEYMRQSYPQIRYSLLTKQEAKERYEKELQLFPEEKIYGFTTENKWELTKAVSALPQFDIIHSLWMESYWGWNASGIRRKAQGWFCSVGGSDLYRFSKDWKELILQKRIIRRATWISSENKETKDYFYKVYGHKCRKIPHDICRFGVDIIDSMRKFQEQKICIPAITGMFPKDKIIVLCGTNASTAHNHLKMISAISKMKEEEREKCFFVFPMTYPSGRDAYISEVREAVQEKTNSYIILTKFMNVDEMAELAMETDIMIHVQDTDQLSSAMVSHMYNGNYIIAGSWLPYESIRDKGVYFKSIDFIDDIAPVLEDAVNELKQMKKKCENNPAIIYKMSSWSETVKDWYQIYENILCKEKRQ